MTDKIGVGVIGTGFGAAAHVPGFKESKDFEVIAVCDVLEERAKEEIPVPQRLLSPKEYPDPRIWPFINLIGLLSQSIREKREMDPSFYEGVKHTEAIEAIRKSHATGRWVSL